MRVVNKEHPDFYTLWAFAPALSRIMQEKLAAKGVKHKGHESLMQVINSAICGDTTHFTLATAGPCVVAYNVVEPWWVDAPLLVEEFIIRYIPGNFADTLRELEQHAATLGCKTLVIADLAMTRPTTYKEYLKRKGFREVSREYIKEVNYGTTDRGQCGQEGGSSASQST